MTLLRTALGGLIAPLVALVALVVTAAVALADSCWTHNGSLMRLVDQGQQRAFLYEAPRPGMVEAGARAGDTLFVGVNAGDFYQGQARLFSSACPGNARPYDVQGPVLRDPLRVVMTGQRPIYNACVPTGAVRTDTLVFVYSHQC